MKFSWTLYFWAFFANVSWIMIMFFAQLFDRKLPERQSLIPGTNQKFLYMEDFWTFAWGCVVGCSLIWVAFFHLAVYWFCLKHWVIFLLLFLFFTAKSAVTLLSKERKPDARCPVSGKLSWNGILYLPHSGFTASAIVFCVWLLPNPGVVALLFISGLACYSVCFLLDKSCGNL